MTFYPPSASSKAAAITEPVWLFTLASPACEFSISFLEFYCSDPVGVRTPRLFEEFWLSQFLWCVGFSLNNTIITKLYSLKAQLWSRELVARRVPQRNVLSRDERIFQEAGMMTGVRTPVVLDWQLGPRRHEEGNREILTWSVTAAQANHFLNQCGWKIMPELTDSSLYMSGQS